MWNPPFLFPSQDGDVQMKMDNKDRDSTGWSDQIDEMGRFRGWDGRDGRCEVGKIKMSPDELDEIDNMRDGRWKDLDEMDGKD